MLLNHETSNRSYNSKECSSSVGNTDEQCNDINTQPIYFVCIIALVLMFVAAFVGNVTVIVSIVRTRSLRRLPSGMYILSLAFSDLLVTLFIIPMKLRLLSDNLYFCDGLILCQTYITIDNILFAASTTNLFVFTVDRYVGLEYGFG